jgi:hypothetical protein
MEASCRLLRPVAITMKSAIEDFAREVVEMNVLGLVGVQGLLERFFSRSVGARSAEDS